jgi:hypothetical protein
MAGSSAPVMYWAVHTTLCSSLRGCSQSRCSTTVRVCVDYVKSLVMLTAKEHEALDQLHYSPVDVDGDVLAPNHHLPLISLGNEPCSQSLSVPVRYI